MKTSWQKILPHFGVIILFIAIALAFFSPVLEGKKMLQSDIVQYTGMAKERNDFRVTRESYWTNSAFGGMPTYQLGAEYPHNYIKSLDKTIRFLPRPADYLFLYFVGFYVLLLVLGVNYRYAFLGALAYGFSTYLIIILQVGHNAKAHAIGYFAFVLSAILLTLRGKYLWGFLLTTIALALEINANHFQMTYYLLFLVLGIGVVYLVRAIREKKILSFVKSIGVLFGALFFSLLLNATSLLATNEYAQFSTRSKSELTFTPEGLSKANQNGLSKEYITEYSYGIFESLNLIVPRLFGGSNNENIGEDSKTFEFLTMHNVSASQAKSFAENLPTYWGEQPIVAAPAYVGIVIFFLFVLGIFIVKGRTKYWLLIGAVLSLLLSWGKNFPVLTNLMIDYFPLYNKFRAVSSVQVILELCIPVLAILALYHFLTNKKNENYTKPLYYTMGIVGGILLLLYIFKGAFSFEGVNDAYYSQMYGDELVQVIVQDRKVIYTADIFRGMLLVGILAGILWAFLTKKLSEKWVFPLLIVLVLWDMVGVAKRYVSNDSFVAPSQAERPFELSPQEEKIRQDTGNYRVFTTHEGLNGARTSYFFHSIGGYHAAKPKAIQELFDYQIYKNNWNILNMLNVKYIVQTDEQRKLQVVENQEALGNAWFVKKRIQMPSADATMKALDTLNLASVALFQTKNQTNEKSVSTYVVDSLSTIRLVSYQPDYLVYESTNSNKGFAVFSEMYYPYDWKATIDGKTTPIYRTDYALRGIEIPAGVHRVEFRFTSSVVKKGGYITLCANIALILLLIGASVQILIKKKAN
ncbi:YfhO family protein [Capnocytophaga catalasegens]|uniref:Membrane protein n=1 Tax=Capnocytophaga catalasegens TaxID=1004260 RepID=A0AAV5AS56_9FLAO|nr:YfhO family protein [Capnocytophaga catalasegens]GIZ15575.1 membrane protein [Capnocytophaga catalasegens]GJM50174.1 membrane protein [Capnocytophaga catalasegens]GJM52063.1 membrane protein [Capnocytophaga catalasegens]